MKKSDSVNKFTALKIRQDKCTQIIGEIVADKKYHKKELLQPVINAMDELIQLAEEKLKK